LEMVPILQLTVHEEVLAPLLCEASTNRADASHCVAGKYQ